MQTANEPIIVDLGKKSKREVDRLRKGRGDLMDDVDDCIHELIAAGKVAESAQPLIIVVAERPKTVAPFVIPSPLLFPWMQEEEEEEEQEEEEEEEEEEDDD